MKLNQDPDVADILATFNHPRVTCSELVEWVLNNRPHMVERIADRLIKEAESEALMADDPGVTSQVICMDCMQPGAPMDLVIPRQQWLLIHPEDDGILCANCMVLRAERLMGSVNLTGIITFADDYTGVRQHPYEWATVRVGGEWKRS